MGSLMRSASEKDITNLVRINNQYSSVLGAKDAKFFQRYIRETYLVEIDESIAGLIVLMTEKTEYSSKRFQWFKERFERFQYVDRVAVDERNKRMGIATEIYSALFREKTPPIVCEISLKNEISIRFHEKFGFVKITEHVFDKEAHGMFAYKSHLINRFNPK